MAFRWVVSYQKYGKTVENEENLTRDRAIKLKCLDCSGGSTKDVYECQIVKCPLYPYRCHRGAVELGAVRKIGGAK